MKPYTDHYKERTSSTSGEEPLYLLEISQDQLAEPARVVRDTEDLIALGTMFESDGFEPDAFGDGVLFQACAFEVAWPDDVQNKQPRAPLRIDNVGRDLTKWIDASNGGKGAQVRVICLMRDTPDIIEEEVTCDLLQVTQNGAFVLGELGYEDILNLPGLAVTYRPDVAPGLF